jgi:signal transduction histidine kinase
MISSKINSRVRGSRAPSVATNLEPSDSAIVPPGPVSELIGATRPPLERSAAAEAKIRLLENENAALRGDLRTFCRRVAHDLRTPLNCIGAASEAFSETPLDADSARSYARLNLNSVAEAGAFLERICFVLSATASPRPAFQPVLMADVVADTLQRLGPAILSATARISSASEWPSVLGEPAWIELIWRNLILNSLQFAGPRPRVELGCETTAGEHHFWVRDSGPGVPPEQVARLFCSLDQLHDRAAPRGYGLSIVRRLIELQSGRCGYARNPQSRGSFFFTLPSA